MADNAGELTVTPDADDLPEGLAAGLQSQIDDLTAVLEHHQRLFETLRAQGLLPGETGDGRA